MKAANTAMVRTDRETYVSDRHVRFDIDATDEAISYFVREDYLPLKAFTTFVNFPDCGQVWNPFLLESYCRRFSRRFRFDSASVNLGNIGAVIRKNCLMNYVDIVVDAIVKSGVSLRDDDVGRFLIDSGYAGKITAAKLGEVMGKAKAVRKRRG
ncbi:MAG: hypothetical protein LBJ20_00410 [Candidatus Methanoplasma sp.]|jgi:hypothetical protein|nr:hypothetical protein [Candidatus Methanoplasma sp.]